MSILTTLGILHIVAGFWAVATIWKNADLDKYDELSEDVPPTTRSILEGIGWTIIVIALGFLSAGFLLLDKYMDEQDREEGE